jgi:hypothetical protein
MSNSMKVPRVMPPGQYSVGSLTKEHPPPREPPFEQVREVSSGSVQESHSESTASNSMFSKVRPAPTLKFHLSLNL